AAGWSGVERGTGCRWVQRGTLGLIFTPKSQCKSLTFSIDSPLGALVIEHGRPVSSTAPGCDCFVRSTAAGTSPTKRHWRSTSIWERRARACPTARGTTTPWRSSGSRKFALDHKLLERPVFGRLEKPRVGQRDRVPTQAETEAILAQAPPEFR